MKIQTKLLELQKEVSAIKKDSTNPFFKSAYFDINKLIETLKPLLNKLKLVIIQPIVIVEGKSVLQTIIMDTESEEKLDSHILLPEGIEPQKMGSAITYYRRYALQSMLFLQAEDDDGSVSSPKNTGVQKTIAKRPSTTTITPNKSNGSPF